MVIVAVVIIPAAQARPDHGRWSPPSWVRGNLNRWTTNRQIWKLEFQTCWGPMTDLAYDPDVRLSHRTLRSWQSVSPQYAAQRLAQYIERKTSDPGYWTGLTWAAAIDGCRNGILWWHYHGNHPG
jgi:hypothetical protein